MSQGVPQTFKIHARDSEQAFVDTNACPKRVLEPGPYAHWFWSGDLNNTVIRADLHFFYLLN